MHSDADSAALCGGQGEKLPSSSSAVMVPSTVPPNAISVDFTATVASVATAQGGDDDG